MVLIGLIVGHPYGLAADQRYEYLPGRWREHVRMDNIHNTPHRRNLEKRRNEPLVRIDWLSGSGPANEDIKTRVTKTQLYFLEVPMDTDLKYFSYGGAENRVGLPLRVTRDGKVFLRFYLPGPEASIPRSSLRFHLSSLLADRQKEFGKWKRAMRAKGWSVEKVPGATTTFLMSTNTHLVAEYDISIKFPAMVEGRRDRHFTSGLSLHMSHWLDSVLKEGNQLGAFLPESIGNQIDKEGFAFANIVREMEPVGRTFSPGSKLRPLHGFLGSTLLEKRMLKYFTPTDPSIGSDIAAVDQKIEIAKKKWDGLKKKTKAGALRELGSDLEVLERQKSSLEEQKWRTKKKNREKHIDLDFRLERVERNAKKIRETIASVQLSGRQGLLTAAEQNLRALERRRLSLVKEAWYSEEFFPKLARFLAELHYRHGVIPEAHTQNLVVMLDYKAGTVEFVVRDLQDAMVDSSVRLLQGKKVNARVFGNSRFSEMFKWHIDLSNGDTPIKFPDAGHMMGGYTSQVFGAVDFNLDFRPHEGGRVVDAFAQEYIRSVQRIIGKKISFRPPEHPRWWVATHTATTSTEGVTWLGKLARGVHEEVMSALASGFDRGKLEQLKSSEAQRLAANLFSKGLEGDKVSFLSRDAAEEVSIWLEKSELEFGLDGDTLWAFRGGKPVAAAYEVQAFEAGRIRRSCVGDALVHAVTGAH